MNKKFLELKENEAIILLLALNKTLLILDNEYKENKGLEGYLEECALSEINDLKVLSKKVEALIV